MGRVCGLTVSKEFDAPKEAPKKEKVYSSNGSFMEKS